MSFAASNPLSAYANVGLESQVSSADPHRLVLMLFDGALVAVARARAAMLERNLALKGESVSRAIQIVEQGLKASLDTTAGGDLALQLRSLYDYISMRLLVASMRNEPAGLDESTRLLSELRDAWQAIGNKAGNGVAANAQRREAA